MFKFITELVALSTELNEHTKAIAAAGNEYKQAISRREGEMFMRSFNGYIITEKLISAAERVLNDLKLDEVCE